MTSPIQVSPLEFLTVAGPSTPPISTAPEPVAISARPTARSTLMSPAPVRTCDGPGLVEADRADPGLVAELAEAAGGAQGGHACLAVEARAGGQGDLDVDRFVAAPPGVLAPTPWAP